MLDFLLRCLVRFLLWLRYRVEIRGLRAVAAKGTSGIVFLPNHPALIDPIILVTLLHKRFKPRAVADEEQISRPVIRTLARRLGVLPMPSVTKQGPAVRAAIEGVIDEAIRQLNAGENLLFYPAGHAQRSGREDLRGNSGVERIVRQAPDARIVLVRTSGLWGSSFSWAGGRAPNVAAAVRRGALALLASGIFFAPRRKVLVEFVEPPDFPRHAPRDAINAYLEAFYHKAAHPNTYVPYTPWERGGVRHLPEPEAPGYEGDLASVPQATREAVLAHLAEMTGRTAMRDDEHLGTDLGLDSLARTELLAWLESEFGLPQGDSDALQTVGDALLAACGQVASSEIEELSRVPRKWFRPLPGDPPVVAPRADTITAAFLEQARRHPRRPILADQFRGVKTYRDVVLSLLLLKGAFEKLEGERLGIMMPASVAASVAYLAALFAGKTPVMVNWTLGPANVLDTLELAGVRRVVTLAPLVARIEAAGIDCSGFRDRLVCLEDLAAGVPLHRKVAALLRSRLSWRSLDKCPVPATAAVLFTSGSEATPKGVPLTHRNMLENLRNVLQLVPLGRNDRMLGFLPPFHAFGLTVGVLAPLCFDLPTVCHPVPTDGARLARLVEAYRATVLVGTPTFLAGILRSGTPRALATLRYAVTGAERCPEHVYDAFARLCPQAHVLEGYGVTECSPIVSVNDAREPRRGTIGKLLPAFDHLLVHPQTGQVVTPPGTGVLLLRGPCVFDGYLGTRAPSPFVEVQGKTWYRTGDIVSEDEHGVLTFRGRLKRFVKRGGEMLSLPAIEAAIRARCLPESDQAPPIAVEATPDETNPEIVLFSTTPLDRDEVNAQLRSAGLSPLHNIRRVVVLPEMPLLGTGKVDYRALKAMLASPPHPGADSPLA